MTNTLAANVSVRYTAADAPDITIGAKQFSLTLTSALRVQGVQNIGTTYEAIDLATMASDGGPAYFFNRDDTNFVEIGREISAAFEAFAKIPPLTGAFLPGVSDKDLFAKADTATVDLEYAIFAP